MHETRAGFFSPQTGGFSSYIPRALPPFPPIINDGEMLSLLSAADRKLGRLDGITEVLPNTELFVAMYVKKEALLSSQIEGTQASFVDVLEAPSGREGASDKQGVSQVVDYVRAMDYGLQRLSELPLSLRLFKEIHGVLLERGRGSNKSPGEFRERQNWIGSFGSTVNEAVFVPPAVPDMHQALSDLEKYLQEETQDPLLIKIALVHAQFETIHPFLDGNGRVGRLLIALWLFQQGILHEPLLYLSYYFKRNRQEYYNSLMKVRLNGDWEGWVKFFLQGVAEVSDEAASSARQIIELKNGTSKLLSQCYPANNNHQRLLDLLFQQPIITKTEASSMLDLSFPTTSSLIDDFAKKEIIIDLAPEKKRNKKFAFSEYIKILEKGTEL